ncbi:hypothetical protein FIBSPDRAFT_968028 [Athelia psychrophila]|uniref:Tyrosine specific protein phosphatases domain-containing protein n=1 Tax=Athelia psychrophila TaxID=1759441 RepID=A0A167V2D9_9AGAM|nr:hypothetical protein FIBSPDRAFT_968028 [Fibularhizoctonia sp. CBS 109695]
METEALDPGYVADILSKPPFVTISGVGNVRDLAAPGVPMKPRLVLRGAEISGITEEGKAQLRALGVTTVYDLRSDTEIAKYNTPIPTIEGVEIIRTPVFKTEDYSPEMMAKRFALYSSGKTEAFIELYSQILDHAGPTFGQILRHIKDRPTDGVLFHCTAGKDRTGVLAAIILKLVGTPDGAVAQDYALTRVGREPSREKIMARLSKEPIFASNSEAALNMFTCRSETMTAFLALLETQYGGAHGYLKQYASFSDAEIEVIKDNLTSPSQSRI